MRQSRPDITLQVLCALFGVSRQAYYEAEIIENRTSIAHMVVLTLVRELRTDMPMIGTRKLLYLLRPALADHCINMGRDQLFDLLGFHGMLVRRRTRMVKTTDSHHWLKRYPNLIIGIVLTGPEQLWVSDITYIRTLEGFSYLSLITDAYSRKIVGHSLYHNLSGQGCLDALGMAIGGRTHKNGLVPIHHSDRGTQYCSDRYVEMLNGEGIAISMTQSGSPYENALAERVNGIIKNEFFPKIIYQNHHQAARSIEKVIETYNGKRPHLGINYLTPNQAHVNEGEITKGWKKYKRGTNKMDGT